MLAIITFQRADNSIIGEPEVRTVESTDEAPALVAEIEARVADPTDELISFALSFKRESTDG